MNEKIKELAQKAGWVNWTDDDNVGALIQMKNDMIAVEKNSEKVIFGN